MSSHWEILKYIDQSGLDQLYIHVGIFRPNALNKVIEGKNFSRCISAFLILYNSIFDILLNGFYNTKKEMKGLVQGVVGPLLMELQMNTCPESVKRAHTILLDGLNEIKFFQEFSHFRKNLQKMGLYLSNVMRMIETMLLFIRATRQQLWELHLASLDGFAKYFFSLDLQNYAKMTPTYLSQIYDLKRTDNESWKFLSKNFFCSRTKQAFVAIGVDHALEHMNKELKILEELRGFPTTALISFALLLP